MGLGYFNYITNKITIIDKDNNQTFFELKTKTEVAKDIVAQIMSEMDLNERFQD